MITEEMVKEATGQPTYDDLRKERDMLKDLLAERTRVACKMGCGWVHKPGCMKATQALKPGVQITKERL